MLSNNNHSGNSTTSSSRGRRGRRRNRRRNYTSLANQDAADDYTNNNNTYSDDDGEEGDVEDFQDEPAGVLPGTTDTGTVTTTTKNTTATTQVDGAKSQATAPSSTPTTMAATSMTVIILDSAQKKFPIPCNPDWTVGTFKQISSTIHKIPPKQQRLIYRGKMLTDDQLTLREYKIQQNEEAQSSSVIVHLFPKPIVTIVASTKNKHKATADGEEDAATTASSANDDDQDPTTDGMGAHVPSIIIDEEEQERRGQILVLGSVEIAEAQNNVKMLSLLLVMICSMRLLALFSIAMGTNTTTTTTAGTTTGTDPYHASVANHTNDVPHNHIYDTDFISTNNIDDEFDYYGSTATGEEVLRTWQTSDYCDLVVSGFGFYVGTLGMKATTENTFQLATLYAIGVILEGIGWNIWNVYEYYKFIQEQNNEELMISDNNNNTTTPQSNNQNSNSIHNAYDDYYLEGDGEEYVSPPLTRDDFITVAFFTILMPMMVWFLCCIRAFEFRRLIREAEEEATERIQNGYHNSNTTADDNDAAGNIGGSNSSNNTHDDDDDNSIVEIV